MKGRIPKLRNRFSYLPKLQGLKHRNASSGLLITFSYLHVGRGQFLKILFFFHSYFFKIYLVAPSRKTSWVRPGSNTSSLMYSCSAAYCWSDDNKTCCGLCFSMYSCLHVRFNKFGGPHGWRSIPLILDMRIPDE